MFPAQSTGRSGAPGALWYLTRDGTGQTRVWATQWDALMRRFQDKAARLLPPLFAFPADGDCASVVGTLRANVRRRDQLDIDGVFGPESRDALGFMLCSAGEPGRARTLARETASGVISDETLRAVILFANHVTSLGTPGEPGVALDIRPEDVSIPTNIVLPAWLGRVASNQADLWWMGTWLADSESPPQAPSQRGAGPAPGPAPGQPAPPPDTGGATPTGTTTPAPGGGTTTTPAPGGSTTTTPAPGGGTTTNTSTSNTTTTTTNTTAAAPWYEQPAVKWGALALVFVGGVLVLAGSSGTPPRRPAPPRPRQLPPPRPAAKQLPPPKSRARNAQAWRY